MINTRLIALAAVALTISACGSKAPEYAQSYTLTSPDGRLSATVNAGGALSYTLSYDGKSLIVDSPIGMKLSDGREIGASEVLSTVTGNIDETIDALFYRKSKVSDVCNTLTVGFDSCRVEFRAYDDGLAWRFATDGGAAASVISETQTFAFAEDFTATVQYAVSDKAWNKASKECSGAALMDAQLGGSDEVVYKTFPLSEFTKDRLAITPLLVNGPDSLKMLIVESDTRSYPCIYLRSGSSNTLTSFFAAYPSVEEQGGHNNLMMLVKEREDYIAKLDGSARTFPWRAVIVSREDKELADNDMVYRLAAPSEPDDDFSWVKPGKVAWDWWNAWNIRGVDFRAGINNDTYKYYIDFASANGIEYVIMDEGWAVNNRADLFQVIPEIDIPMLCRYAESRNVGIILWAGYKAFSRDIEGVCRHFAEMGVKGYKIDFMNRSDQIIEDFLETAASTAARYHQVVDFHGIHKPTGLQRKYPNILNFEGIFGLEQMKFADVSTDMVTFDVQLPFIRYAAGYADYTQGAMINSIRQNFRVVYSEPQSQGTRCHQLAEYVVFYAPLNMLCDSPSNYMDNQECTSFIASVPTTWDETVMLDGKVGEYVAMARRKGDKWYVAALNGWDERDLDINLGSFVNGRAVLDAWADGINADRCARDYSHCEVSTDVHGVLRVHLAPGGGFIGTVK